MSLHNVDSCHFIFLWLYEGCYIWSCFGIDSLEVVTWNTSNRMINIHFWSPSHFISWFNIDWHFGICDSSWLDWFLRLNIHLPFSITSSTSTPRHPFVLLRCMVHRSQVLINPSSTTIEVLTSSCIFFGHMIEAHIHLV